MDNPCVWLPEPSWDNVSELDKLTNFHGIVMSFEQYSRDWNIWYTSAEPETSVLPGTFYPTLATPAEKIARGNGIVARILHQV